MALEYHTHRLPLYALRSIQQSEDKPIPMDAAIRRQSYETAMVNAVSWITQFKRGKEFKLSHQLNPGSANVTNMGPDATGVVNMFSDLDKEINEIGLRVQPYGSFDEFQAKIQRGCTAVIFVPDENMGQIHWNAYTVTEYLPASQHFVTVDPINGKYIYRSMEYVRDKVDHYNVAGHGRSRLIEHLQAEAVAA